LNQGRFLCGEGASVGQGAAGIVGWIFADSLVDPLVGAPGPDGIELVKGQAERIDPAVTSGAVYVPGVRLDFLANCRLGAVRWIRLDWLDIRRWWRWRFSENCLADPNSAVDRAMAGAVRGQREDGPHCQQTTAMVLGAECHALKAGYFWSRQAVEIAEAWIGHRPVGGDERGERQVIREDFVKVVHHFFAHTRLQPNVVLWVEFTIRRKHSQAMELKPLAREVVDEPRDLWITQHPVDLGSQVVTVASQSSTLCCFNEALVRHGTPQEIR